jgi:hypothetical protein
MSVAQINWRSGKTLRTLVFSGLFLFAQMFGLAHAAEFGAAKHQHGGVACSVSICASDGEKLNSVSPVLVPAAQGALWLEPIKEPSRIITVRNLQRLIRGPPASQNP